MFRELPVPHDLFCEVVDRELVVDSYVKERVDALWESECSNNPHLFDGQVFNLVSLDQPFKGFFIPYRYLLAIVKDSELRNLLNIHPLAVNGVSIRNGSVLFAKRSAHMLQCPGMMELAPSGTVDPASVVEGRVDLKRALLKEGQEELGWRVSDVKRMVLLGMLEDSETGIYEVVFMVDLQSNAGSSLPVENDEYASHSWVPQDKIGFFISNNNDLLSLLSINILNLYIDK